MKSFSWVFNALMIPITSVIILLLSSFLFLGGQKEFEALLSNMPFSFINRSLNFALLGIPSLVFILLFHLTSVSLENAKPHYWRITQLSACTFLGASAFGTTIFFFL